MIKTSGLVVGELDQGRTGVQRCFDKPEQWRAIAMRSDMTARAHSAAITLLATLIWIETDVNHMAWPTTSSGPSSGVGGSNRSKYSVAVCSVSGQSSACLPCRSPTRLRMVSRLVAR
ncbi:hypothetical protein SAMN05421776_101710 [Nocardia farcinica]|uniref:Transposase n=1 Tax=Nocardia farcinica TaxID=37329 RepID=A0A0H5NZV1_NOCFR|nr:Uncharacterised protein [Nocardia farcinica]SIS69668.1 hypothetical protein SAMN05421776_101710 [Nocardia farcinica]